MLFEGEEWAASTPFQYFADHDDPEMARLVAEGRKKEFAAFGWPPESIPNPEKRETFERCKLNWSEVHEGEHAEMLAWHRDLIHFRRTTPSLNNVDPGHTHVQFNEEELWFTMRRGEVELYCNLGTDDHTFRLPEDGDLVLGSRSEVRLEGGSLSLPSNSVAAIDFHHK
jgi:maltooligosyltrehalose trehalohydrolase